MKCRGSERGTKEVPGAEWSRNDCTDRKHMDIKHACFQELQQLMVGGEIVDINVEKQEITF
ncbi:MAG: hypothetical protein PHR83_17600 [Paludibacter sp.]|nr:hypothetical protein [Paludibacter sp.]